jgi:hypothetical protein
MKQAVLIEDLQIDESHQLHIDVPPDMGRQFRVIVLPMDHPIQPGITQDEAFTLGAYSSVTEDDPQEDAIWEKYIRD